MKASFSFRYGVRLGPAFCLLMAANSFAQDALHIAPKIPEKTGQGTVVNQTQPKPAAGPNTNEVLVAQLKGIVLEANPKEVRTEGVTGKTSVDPGDVTLAQLPDFPAVVQPYLGQPVTMTSLSKLSRSIVAFYRNHDRPVVDVYVPDQR